MRTLRRLSIGLLGAVALLWVALSAYAYWPMQAEVPARQLANTEDRFVEVDGLELRYRSWGVAGPGKPDLVLIHGFANSLQSWRELAPLLAGCCHVVALDLPGYGLSAKPVEHDYHNGPQAAVVVAAAHALGLRQAIYVGHSLGGAIALQAVVKDRDAAGLILMNPGILSTGVPRIVQLPVPPLPRLSARMFADRQFRENFLKKSYVNESLITPAVMDDVMLAARSEGYATGMTSLMQQYAEGEEIALAPQVRVPTLIVWGDQDRNKPLNEADQLQALLPGSALVRFANAGHYVHEEVPQPVATAMIDWLIS